MSSPADRGSGTGARRLLAVGTVLAALAVVPAAGVAAVPASSGSGTTATGTTTTSASGTGTAAPTGSAGTITGTAGGTNTAKPPAQKPKHAKPKPKPRPDVILSNETTRTTYSAADVEGPIRSQPNIHAPVIARLQFLTVDGFWQTYIVLREHWTRSTAWVRVRIPGRPNGRLGWVLRNQLDGFRTTNAQLVVDRGATQLTLFRKGRVVFRAPVGTGKPSTPTPPGHFWITESFGSSDPAYGAWAFGTSDYSVLTDWPGGGIVGLHGTNEPDLVPGHPSHGCIRLHDDDVVALARILGHDGIGTPLLIR